MKILQLDIAGFRSLKNVSWKPGDLNVIIGPNGSGKSNLLRFLELMSISAQGRLGKHIQSLGGMKPIVWDGQASSISTQVKTLTDDENLKLQQAPATYALELARLGSGSYYRIAQELLADFHEIENGSASAPLKLLERTGTNGVIFDARQHAIFANENSLKDDETLLSMVSGPFASNLRVKLFQMEMALWRIYHDVLVHQNAVIRQAAITRSERLVDPDGQNLISVLHTLYETDREFREDVNAAMLAAFGEDFDELVFLPDADQRIQLCVRWKSLKREQSAADLSDGILRFLLLLIVLANPSPPSLIAIDEPEIGLHPSMLSIIAEFAVEAAMRTQVIFTTHSPQFLDAFRDTKPTTTVAKWENGETTLKVLEGKDLDYWLKGYSLGALYESGKLEQIG